MDSYPDEAWRRVGRMLVARRPRIDPAYRTRKTFAEQTGLADKTVQEIENAYRTSFTDELLAEIEGAYRLSAGSIRKALADPSITDFTSPTPQQRLGDLLPGRRIELNPTYAARRAFAAAVGLDEAFVEDIEYGRVPVLDSEQQAAVEDAYCWARGSVATVLAGGDPTPIDIRHVTGSSYLAATSGAVVPAQAGDLVVLDLRTPPDDASDDVKALWNNYDTERRIIWHLPIPLYERELLQEYLHGMRAAVRKARQQHGGNGDSQAS